MFLLILVSISSLILTVTSYQFNTNSCSNSRFQQSPIDISSASSLYFDEKYFRFLTNNYIELTTENKWKFFTEERAVGIEATTAQETLGSFIFVKDWAMYSFDLKKILFRTTSEHRIDGKIYDLEMQLVHTLDANYYAPGRRIDLGVDNLVISIFFSKTSDSDPARSKLFEFMNSAGGIGQGMSRNIKLHHIIQHQPSYLYQGSLTYPECQPALWLIYSQYHLIGQKDFDALVGLIRQSNAIIDPITRNNVRDLSVNRNTPVYRNWNDLDKMVNRPTLMAYGAASFINISYVTIVAMIFSSFLLFF